MRPSLGSLREESNMRLIGKKEKTPLDLLQVAKAGGEAETVKRVMGEVISRELDLLLSQFAATKPDLGEYARLAGQAQILNKIKRAIDYKAAEGAAAAKELRR